MGILTEYSLLIVASLALCSAGGRVPRGIGHPSGPAEPHIITLPSRPQSLLLTRTLAHRIPPRTVRIVKTVVNHVPYPHPVRNDVVVRIPAPYPVPVPVKESVPVYIDSGKSAGVSDGTSGSGYVGPEASSGASYGGAEGSSGGGYGGADEGGYSGSAAGFSVSEDLSRNYGGGHTQQETNYGAPEGYSAGYGNSAGQQVPVGHQGLTQAIFVNTAAGAGHGATDDGSSYAGQSYGSGYAPSEGSAAGYAPSGGNAAGYASSEGNAGYAPSGEGAGYAPSGGSAGYAPSGAGAGYAPSGGNENYAPAYSNENSGAGYIMVPVAVQSNAEDLSQGGHSAISAINAGFSSQEPDTNYIPQQQNIPEGNDLGGYQHGDNGANYDNSGAYATSSRDTYANADAGSYAVPVASGYAVPVASGYAVAAPGHQEGQQQQSAASNLVVDQGNGGEEENTPVQGEAPTHVAVGYTGNDALNHAKTVVTIEKSIDMGSYSYVGGNILH